MSFIWLLVLILLLLAIFGGIFVWKFLWLLIIIAIIVSIFNLITDRTRL